MEKIENEDGFVYSRNKLDAFIKLLDSLPVGEKVLIRANEVRNVRSLYLAMYRRGKKFEQKKLLDKSGWIFKRVV